MGKPAILLVDDQKSIIDLEKSFLKGADLQIITASTGSEALQSIIKERPEVVFLDLMLPGMNGDAVCNFVKNREELKDTAVIILTAKDDQNSLQRCFKCGCDAYVTKPITRDEFLDKIKFVLDEKGIYLNWS
ncbi:MAG: response regulator [Deltaproteobacteria bacterium]|nr:MAG: response regulator [Deltaproteobacteria bacterium]